MRHNSGCLKYNPLKNKEFDMKFEEYRSMDATALAEGLRRKKFSRAQVFQAASERIDAANPALNFIAQDLRRSAQKQEIPADGIFAGVPFLIKDLLAQIKGVPTTCASRLMAETPAAADSDLVAAYRRAGLVFAAKTTVPEWGLMPYTESEFFGISRNPWDKTRTCGGSSGGSAAAVAAGVVPMAHGGDGGGSIRIPSSNCGLFGLKPSRGLVSLGPLLSEAWQGMVGEHVLTRSVRDSAAMLDIAAGARHSAVLYGSPRPEKSYASCLKNKLPRLKIAVSDKPWLGGYCTPEIREIHKKTVHLLDALGHDVREARIEFSPPEILAKAALILVAGETAKTRRLLEYALNRRLGYRDFEPTTWIMMQLGETFTAGQAFWAREVMLEQGRIAARFHEKYDIICTPTLPRLTPKTGELAVDSDDAKLGRMLFGTMNLSFLLKNNPIVLKNSEKSLQYTGFTLPFNMTGQPAMSVPLFRHQDRLPAGSQFAAAHGRDDLLLQLAAELEKAQPWFNVYPPEKILNPA